MKNNKMMRVASALLVAVLLTTCVISGTFAKYTTSASGNDSARVAKWGVSIAAVGTTFANAYEKDDSTVTGFANSVIGAESAKVVAPDTSGTMAAAQISGTPEVAVKVTYAADVTLTGWTIDANTFYCPIIFTIKTGDTVVDTIDGKEYTTAAALQDAIRNTIVGQSQTYAPGTTLSSQNTTTISWEWPFSTSAVNDVKDTKLGDLSTAPTISLSLTVTVTQVD